MMKTQTETPPLGVIDSISAGFGTVAQKPGLLFIPFLLDLFLWLGPRLSVTPIAPELAARLSEVVGQTADNSAALFQQNMTEILGSFNLFSALSTWPLGVPSLLAGNDPGIGPLGMPSAIQVHGVGQFMVWLLALILGGLLLGSFFLGPVARLTSGNYESIRTWTLLVWPYWIRIVAFVMVVLIGAFILSVPFFLTVEIIAQFLAPLASLVVLVGVGLGMWALFHLFFAAHGILIDGLPVLSAMGKSVILIRQYPFSSVGLLLVAVLIDLGLSTIWNMPSSESWMRLVAIAGNAFVNTSLAAATCVYYCERTSGPSSTRSRDGQVSKSPSA